MRTIKLKRKIRKNKKHNKTTRKNKMSGGNPLKRKRGLAESPIAPEPIAPEPEEESYNQPLNTPGKRSQRIKYNESIILPVITLGTG